MTVAISSTQPTAQAELLGRVRSQAHCPPSSGWLIQGVCYATDEYSRLVSVPFAQTYKGPNVLMAVETRVILAVDAFCRISAMAFAFSPALRLFLAEQHLDSIGTILRAAQRAARDRSW